MNRPTTRRALIGGACVLALAGTTATSQAATAATVSPRLARLIALHSRAVRALELYSDTVEEPALDLYDAALKSYTPEAEPPHRSVNTTFVNVAGDTVRLATDKWAVVESARAIRDDASWADVGADRPEWRQAHLELADLDDARAAEIAQQKARKRAYDDAVRKRLGLDEIVDRSNALSGREFALWEAAIAEPAQSAVDLAAKLDMNDRLGRVDSERVLASISADIRRLAGNAA